MPGVDPAEHAGVGVEFREHRGGEGGAAERFDERVVDERGGVGQGSVGAAGVAVRRDGQGGELGAAQAMSHAVEDGDPRPAGVHGVVDRVARDLIGRLQSGGDGHLVAGEGQRRQQRPLHLGGQPHSGLPAQPHDGVPVHRLGHDQFGDQGGEAAQPHAEQTRSDLRCHGGVHRHAEHAEPLDAVQQRKPDPDAAVGRILRQDLDVLESPPRKGRVDAERFDLPSDTGAARVEERNQNPLLEIDQIHQRVVRAQRGRVPRDQPCELVRGGQMSVLQQRVHSTFRITHPLPGATHPRNSNETAAADAGVSGGGEDLGRLDPGCGRERHRGPQPKCPTLTRPTEPTRLARS